ncbi:MAG: DUF4402 domain-containing protein [Halofilum sp. (in: g-proteobacteria)]
MQKSKLAIATSTVIGLSGIAYQSAVADSASTTASAEVIQALVVNADAPLNFGTLAISGTAGTGSVTMTSGGSVTGDGAIVTSTIGAAQAAAFTIGSGGDDGSVAVSVTAADLTHSTAADSLTWSAVKARHNLSGTTPVTQSATGNTLSFSDSITVTTADLTAYGDIDVPAASTSGTYTGTITVTANRT